MLNKNNFVTVSQNRDTPIKIFGFFFVITFLLYLPDVKAGWVIDAAGWVNNVSHQSFWDYINRSQSQIASLYQFTQFITFVFYKIWGINVWAWSILYMVLHTCNATLLYLICSRLLIDSGSKNSRLIAITGVMLFIICPHSSEVLIWKACYHYLQGFLFILLILYWVQKYQHQQKTIYALCSGSVFLCSAFSLEIFYLTPLFASTIPIYYYLIVSRNRNILAKSIFVFLIPQVIILIFYFFLFKFTYKEITPHVYNLFTQSWTEYFSKPPKYLFHILFLGRYFPFHFREQIYALCNRMPILITYYGIVTGCIFFCCVRFLQKKSFNKPILLLFIWSGISVVILMPLPFADVPLYVFFDRYTYLFDGFFYILLATVLFQITEKRSAIFVIILYGSINLFFTIRLNIYWKQSAYINNRLLRDIVIVPHKTTLLLNLPENMNGAPMIGAQPDGEFESMRVLFIGIKDTVPIYDVASYNMTTPRDGAHVTVKNDSTVKVTLNQWGTWWWYEGHGGRSYENNDYKVNMTDAGHEYELTLKHGAENYVLYYEVGEQWHRVDMQKLGVEQN